jgi:hypothetical protein
MVIVFAWMNFGFNTVLYLAGHQAHPERAVRGGRDRRSEHLAGLPRITVPQLRNTTFYVLITTSILALQLFDIVWILSRPEPGGPEQRHDDPGARALRGGVPNNSQGYASALAWILFAIIFVFTFFQFRRDREGRDGRHGVTLSRRRAGWTAARWEAWRERQAQGAQGHAVRVATYALLVLVAIMVLFPFVVAVSTSLKNNTDIFTYPPSLIPRRPR